MISSSITNLNFSPSNGAPKKCSFKSYKNLILQKLSYSQGRRVPRIIVIGKTNYYVIKNTFLQILRCETFWKI